MLSWPATPCSTNCSSSRPVRSFNFCKPQAYIPLALGLRQIEFSAQLEVHSREFMLLVVNNPIRVLLCDDQFSIRAHLRKLLGSTSGVQIVGEASGGRTGVQLALDLKPDVVIMDISMPDLNGIEATRQIRERLPATRVIIHSAESSQGIADQAFSAGACAYVSKNGSADELVHALFVAMEGERYVSPQISLHMSVQQKPEGRSAAADQSSSDQREAPVGDDNPETANPIRVVLVDQTDYVRERLVELLSAVKGVEVIGQASDVPTASHLIGRLQPDVVVLDLDLPGHSGMDLLAMIHKDSAGPLIIILTNFDYPVLRQACAKLGADFYFYKPVEFERVAEVCQDLANRKRKRSQRPPEA